MCLGHQAIGEYFGATLQKAATPKHGKFDWVTQTDINSPILKNIPTTFGVTRYHSLILTQVKAPLNVLATTANNEVMALNHSYLPIYGIQFHPESCLTENGLTLIKNFTDIIQQSLR